LPLRTARNWRPAKRGRDFARDRRRAARTRPFDLGYQRCSGRDASGAASRPAARNAEPPTLARRFPVVPGARLYPLVPPLPVLESVTAGPPPFRGRRTIATARDGRPTPPCRRPARSTARPAESAPESQSPGQLLPRDATMPRQPRLARRVPRVAARHRRGVRGGTAVPPEAPARRRMRRSRAYRS
jgi:hypothetical protein